MEEIETFADYLLFVKGVFYRILETNRRTGNTCMELGNFAQKAQRYTFMEERDVPCYLRAFHDDIICFDGLVGFKTDYDKDVVIHRKVTGRMGRRTLDIKTYPNGKLCKAQKDAVGRAPATDISIITGGAGTGKTTIINQMLYNFNRTYHGEKNAFVMAPTGRAAKRAKETITEQCNISTVHYFAGWGHPLNRRDYQRIRSADFIIVDEASMLSAETFCLLMQITDAPVVLVGDINQLPAVEAGNILKDLVSLGVPTYYLTKNYRSDSEILANANAFIDDTGFRGLTASEKFRFVSLDEADITDSLAGADADIILTPFRKEGIAGSCTEINALIHRRKGFSDNLFHAGEPVIILKTNKKGGYVNGETGYVTAVTAEEIYVDLGDRVVAVRDESELDLNYACTIHKSQGSEYDTVALYCPDSTFITRNTLYTAITRAKHQVTVYFTDDTVFRNAYTRNTYTRSTFLSAFAA